LPAVNKENWRQVTRATPAHSTVTIADQSSCRFLESGAARRLLGGTPIVAGPHHVHVERDPDGTTLHASHDGYASECGVIHHRALRLSADGRVLDGEDSFSAAGGDAIAPGNGVEFAVRFHLHPAVKANRLADGRGVILLLQDREVWTFATLADSVEIEESVFLAGSDGPRRTVQIVIYGRVDQQGSVRWNFRHTPPAATGSRPDRVYEPELPL
jgi:uncharacterized heparinase superfamily protein